jgi:hypothetical protein
LEKWLFPLNRIAHFVIIATFLALRKITAFQSILRGRVNPPLTSRNPQYTGTFGVFFFCSSAAFQPAL